MNKYSACVKDKETKKYIIIESEYNNKKDFIKDLHRNGYSVYRRDRIKNLSDTAK
jgi:hypothetical protein